MGIVIKSLLVCLIFVYTNAQFPSLNFMSTKIDSTLRDADPIAIVPTIDTPLGKLVGEARKSRDGKWFYAFEGIPYAQPPTRFTPSIPVTAWNGTLDARKPGAICVQHNDAGTGIMGGEDCLFLNVYFPHYDLCKVNDTQEPLPVIFNIHGGSYTTGAGSIYGPQFWMDECVVYVSINYRLGVLGFMTTEDGVMPGNLGLKDQALALKWNQNYISNFRGDPNLVTIIGISAGASSVSHHVTSSMSKGLFHRAVSESGSVLNPWSITKNPNYFAFTLAGMLNCTTETTQALKTCMESKDLPSIISAQESVFGLVPFGPVVEPLNTTNPFRTELPRTMLKNGNFNRVPIINGFMQDEGAVGDQILAALNGNWFGFAPIQLSYNQLGLTKEESNTISTKIRNFYFGDKAIDATTRQNVTNLLSDRAFITGIFEAVQLHTKYAPAYSYVMTYKGGPSFARQYAYQVPMATHGDDGQYFFPLYDMPVGTENYVFSKELVKSWATFAKNGAPSPPGKNAEPWFPIFPFGRSNAAWYRLDMPTGHYNNYLDERRRFWESLGV